MMKKLLFLSIVLLNFGFVNAQSIDNEIDNKPIELHLFFGVNQYVPFSHSFLVRTLPPFWYSFDEDEIRIGGQTLGLNLYKPFGKNMVYVGQAHLKSQRFSFGEITFTDENGQPIGAATVTHQEFALKHVSLLGKQVNNTIVAIGVGTDIYLASFGVLDRRDIVGMDLARTVELNNLYKNISPLISALFIRQYGKWSLNVQADYAFLNRYRTVVPGVDRPTYLSVTVGAGFKIL